MNATATQPLITAFDWVPPFAKGLVRDLRIRWALEEIGQSYDTELLDARNSRPDAYLARQPFDQVPAFRAEGMDLFETGAILLYLGEKDQRLLPTEQAARWTAISWLFSALNSVEPFLMPVVICDLRHSDKDWMPEARAAFMGLCQQKLKRVTDALGLGDWLAGQFSVADIAMITVLNNLRHTDLVAQYPALDAYMQRGKSRPAYERALAGQMADFVEEPA